MSQERWDVVIRYLSGPLSMQEDQVYRGPVVRFGANPGPGGVNLKGYRGLNDRHAVITSYQGGTAAVASVGMSQVRIAPHEHVDWDDMEPINATVYLSEGCAVHLGPPERGISFTFVECRRLGVWENRRILSDASQAEPGLQPTQVKSLTTESGMPSWFIGGMVMIGLVTAVAVLMTLIRDNTGKIDGLGPIEEGQPNYEVVSLDAVVNSELREGLDQPFDDFLMRYNAEAAGNERLRSSRKEWDAKLLDRVTQSFELHARGWSFYERLERVVDDYAYVVGELRLARLPDVFAAIPYRESTYRSDLQSIVCANGFWQFMPESANRFGLEVRGCRIRGGAKNWSPTRVIPVYDVLHRAEYVRDKRCLIKDCDRDEREDLPASTRAAMAYLAEPFEDVDLQASGAVVQLSITAFNAGYDDSRFEEKREKDGNVLTAYRKYLRDKNLTSSPWFLGENIKCADNKQFSNEKCGSYLYAQSQHYAYNIIAQHFLAVCYYSLNHDDHPSFQKWRDYSRGDGYCTRVDVPTVAQVRKRIGR